MDNAMKHVSVAIGSSLGSVIGGPSGALIGGLAGRVIAILPGLDDVLNSMAKGWAAKKIQEAGSRVTRYFQPEEMERVNHDLQTALRDALREAIHDVGGYECFPSAWPDKKRDVPQPIVFPLSPAGHHLWQTRDPLAAQVCECLQSLVKALDDERVLPLDPPAGKPAASVYTYFESNTPEAYAQAFYDQVLQPFLSQYTSLFSEVPELPAHLQRYLLDRTLVHLGEMLKERTPAWRAFNRLMLEDIREMLNAASADRTVLHEKLDALLAQPEGEALTDFSGGIADLISATGRIEKRVDERMDDLLRRVSEQHDEVLANFSSLLTISQHIVIKIDGMQGQLDRIEEGIRALRIREDGQLQAEGSSPVPLDLAAEPGETPFQGLRFFSEEDASRFFGREVLTAKLVGRMREESFLAVVGASGSGKSSLVRAGMIPALRSGNLLADGSLPPQASPQWNIRVLTPTNHPLDALAAALTSNGDALSAISLRDQMEQDKRSLLAHCRMQPTPHTLIVIDQFEEVFTLCRDDSERLVFVNNLLCAAEPGNPVSILITLRADFYAACARIPGLPKMLEEHQAYIEAMSAEELQRAIEEPARQGSWQFEPGLVDLILRDFGSEKGALPLLSHALLKTWENRHGRMMTLESYAAAGGVHGAIAKTAEETFCSLNGSRQEIARRIFLRLTELGDGTADTRRRAFFHELSAHDGEMSEVEWVLKLLTDARLLTVEEETVEISHEALLREWDTLRKWLEENRDGLRIHQHLTDAALEWAKRDRDLGELYRGTRLHQALEWANQFGAEMNDLEQEFLQASITHCKKEERQKRRWKLVAVGAGIFLLAGMTAAAILFQNQAQKEQDQRILAEQQEQIAQEQRILAEEQERIARSGELAARSQAVNGNYPQLGALLAVESVNILQEDDPIGMAPRQALVDSLETISSEAVSLKTDAQPRFFNVSPDGNLLVSAYWEEDRLMIWDMQSDEPQSHPKILQGTIWMYFAEFSPDSRWLVSLDGSNTLSVWDLAQKGTASGPYSSLSFQNFIYSVSFSPDGKWLAVNTIIDDRDSIVLHPFRNGRLGEGIVLSPFSSLSSFTFTQNQGQIWLNICGTVEGEDNGYLYLWRIDENGLADEPIMRKSPMGWIGAAFSPDGRWMFTSNASFAQEDSISIWSLNEEGLSETPIAALGGIESWAGTISINSSGTMLATSDERNILIWKLDDETITASGYSGEEILPWLRLTGHKGSITNLVFSPNGDHLASSGMDGSVRLWDLNAINPEGSAYIIRKSEFETTFLDFASGEDWIVTGNNQLSTDIKLWKSTSSQLESAYPILRAHNGQIFELTSDEKQWLASVGADGNARVWNVKDPENIPEPATLSIPGDSLRSVAIDPQAQWVAAGGKNSKIYVWDLRESNLSAPSIELNVQAGEINYLSFSRNGQWLASVSTTGITNLWSLQPGGKFEPVALQMGTAKFSDNGVLRFSLDSRWLVSSTADHVYLWDLEDHAHQYVIDQSRVDYLSFTVDSQGLIACNRYGASTMVWDISDPQNGIENIGESNDIFAELSRDGKWGVTGKRDHSAYLDNLQDNIDGYSDIVGGHSGSLWAATFSNNSEWMSLLDYTGFVWVYDLRSEGEIASSQTKYAPHDGDRIVSNHLIDINDETWLFYGTARGNIYVRPLSFENQLNHACQAVERNLTQKEWTQYLPDQEYRLTCPVPVKFGAVGGSLDEEIALAMDLPENQKGALVVSVVAESPAERAGLHGGEIPYTYYGEEVMVGGDIIIAVDGVYISDFQDLLNRMMVYRPGNTVTLKILRSGEQMEIKVELEEREAENLQKFRNE